MKRLLLTICAAILLLQRSPAIIIPITRMIDWRAGIITGVPGGIPTRTTIYKNIVTDLGADPTGATDCSAIIQNALASCPANQVVYAPAGTYKISNRVYVSSSQNYTLRGAGQGQTIFAISTSGSIEPFHFGSSDYPRPGGAPGNPIISGASKGSTLITLADTSAFTVGKMCRIEEPNPTWVHTMNTNNYALSCMFKVVSKTAASPPSTPGTVTLNHPIPIDFTNNPITANYSTGPWAGIGIEDCTIDMANSQAAMAIYFEMLDGSWIKNVEIKNCYSKETFFLWCTNCEIRRCYVHDGRGGGPNHEGLDFYEDGCWNLVEDNIIISAGYPAIILGDSRGGCAGNAIGYNYIANAYSGNGIAPDAICDNHGPHNMMNVIEGNIAQSFESDGYFGSSGYGTIFRNYLSGKFTAPDNGIARAIALKHYANYYNIVGNVLGDPGITQAYDIEVASYNGYGANNVIYQLGYPNPGNTYYSGTIGPSSPPDYTTEPNSVTQPVTLDYNVKSTILRHGNYIYATGYNRIEWDSTISDHSIPNSIYYASKPAWWPSDVVWPPIGPDLTPMVCDIPAKIRFQGFNTCTGGGGGGGATPGEKPHVRSAMKKSAAGARR